MNLSYYTVDDLRLGHDPKGVVGWRMSQFLSLDDALTHYVSLPATGVKSLGLTDVWRSPDVSRSLNMTEKAKTFWPLTTSSFRSGLMWRRPKQQHRHALPPCGLGTSFSLTQLFQFQKVTPCLQN